MAIVIALANQKADLALYQAKTGGRNRVSSYDEAQT